MKRITGYLRNSAYGLIAGLLLTLAVPAAQAQTLNVLHFFTGGQDGGVPEGLVAVDRAGNVYGSATSGGSHNAGTVFRSSNKNGAWILTPLYQFQGGNDGSDPLAGVTLGPDGNIYGTTLFGGGTGCITGLGCGTVFKLTPPASICHMAVCPWTETVLYRANSDTDPCCFFGGVVVDNSGNIYGMGQSGGNYGQGAVYKLSPSGGGNYTLDVIYSFTGGNDGAGPSGTLTLDAAGNVYGASTYGGGGGFGTLFKLVRSAGQYTFELLYTFTGGSDGGMPEGNVVLDRAGNLYGTTAYGGGVFELTPSAGSWSYSLIVPFVDGLESPLSLDAAGNIYGTTYAEGSNDDGSVFELTDSQGTWTHNILHSFSNNGGALPLSGVAFDASGNLYGTTTFGGSGDQGTLWQLTP
jgi:uncharacterized repeat protein (TIGR03803 family)